MGSLFFSCVGIKFSDRYNARYGREDLFRHLVVMRGKHGYAEGTSNVEGVDASTPPLPSGRWTLGKIRSVPEDRMMARCDRMIRRSVKRLKRHGLFRKPVDLAIDFHDICRYDKNPNMKFMRHSKYKNGTHLFNTLATVHCVTEGSRACLGALLRTAETPKAEMVTALLDMCRKNGIRVGTLLLDREFYSTEIMNQLDARDITWLMPAVKNGAIKEEIAKFERGERGPVSIHSIRSSKISAEFTLIIRPAQDENDARETATGTAKGERESAYHVFATNVPPGTVASDPDRFVETYRRRWGIETAYRCYEQVRPRTASRHESVRLLLLFFPLLLYNAWILARHLLERITGAIGGMTLKIFSKYLDVLSCESVRRQGPPDTG